MARRGRKLARRMLCLLILGLLLWGAIFFRRQFRMITRDLAITQAKNQASDLINDAISQQMATDGIRYERIIYFEKDLQGRITALKTNMGEMNRLKTDILNLINDEILALDTNDIGIPLGSIILPEIFSGKGPDLPVRVISISNSEGDFFSNFSEAGINQTLHQLIMSVRLDVTILVLNETETFDISSQVVVAETVIVGTVPDTFFSADGTITP